MPSDTILRGRRQAGVRVRRLAAALVIAAVVGSSSAASPVRAETIDRILAVVGGELILLSDVHAARRFGLVAPAEGAADPTRAMLNALIDRQLQLIEVARFAPPDPPPAAVDERMAAIRRQFADERAFDAALAEVGLSEEQLRTRVRDGLRVDSYRAQRFGAALEPTEEDLLRYYREHGAEFRRDGVLPPMAEVREQVKERLVGERSRTLIADWLDTLRRRTEVQILYPAE